MQLPAGTPFPRRLSVDRHGDIMILRTPIISESYSPDSESALPTHTKNMLGYVALELGSQIRSSYSNTKFYLQRDDAFVLAFADLWLAAYARCRGPIRNMVNTVDRIRRGQLDSRYWKDLCWASWTC